MATCESIVRDLTGRALIDTFADGSSRFTLKHGHLAVGNVCETLGRGARRPRPRPRMPTVSARGS